MERVYLGLGSNVGDRRGWLRAAVDALGEAGLHVAAVSSVYATEPRSDVAQPWYLNAVVEVSTRLPPQEVLHRILGIESVLGRTRDVRWGPRNIDIDLLLYGDRVVDEPPELVVPHPRLPERAFVLVPLSEIAPDAQVSGHGRAADLAASVRRLAGQRVLRRGTLRAVATREPHSGRGRARPGARRRPSPGSGASPADDVRRAVLERLGAGPAPGPQIARTLGVTRAAVWKHVNALRAQGYPITASARGYALAPEYGADLQPLSAAQLGVGERRVVGTQLRVLGAVDSTNALARQLGLQGAPDGLAVVADAQTAGRGRNGRSFASPPGGLYVSVLLRPMVPPAEAVRLTLLAAVAVADAIELASGLRPEIKWPNDILLSGGKVCGILLEMVAAEDRVDFVVLGCGVNVAVVPDVPGACSLRALGATVTRARLGRELLQALDDAYLRFRGGGWHDILAAYRSRCATISADVRVTGADGSVLEGRAVDVDADGALILEERGIRRRVLAGDVSTLRAAAPPATRAAFP